MALFPRQTQTQALLDLAEMFLAWLAGNGVDGQWGFGIFHICHTTAWICLGFLWFEPFGRRGSWNPTLFLSLNSILLFLSDWLPPSLLSGHGSGKEKESSQAGNARKKQSGTWWPGSLSQLVRNFVRTSTNQSHISIHLSSSFDLNILILMFFCCSQICGRWTAMEVFTTSLASWQKSRQAGGKNPIVSDCLFVVPRALSHVPPCPAMSYSTRFCLMSVQCRHVQIANSVFQFIEETKPWFLRDPNAEATWVSLCSFLHGITGVSLMCCTVSKRGLTCRAAEKDLPPCCLSRAGKCFTSKATRWRSTVCSWDLSKLLLACLFSQPVFYISLVYVARVERFGSDIGKVFAGSGSVNVLSPMFRWNICLA